MKPQGAKRIELTWLAVISVVEGSATECALDKESLCGLGETLAARIHCRYTLRRLAFPSEPFDVAYLGSHLSGGEVDVSGRRLVRASPLRGVCGRSFAALSVACHRQRLVSLCS